MDRVLKMCTNVLKMCLERSHFSAVLGRECSRIAIEKESACDENRKRSESDSVGAFVLV